MQIGARGRVCDNLQVSYLVARIGKPHGLRGEVTVQVHTDDPEGRFVPGMTFATEAQPGSGVPRELTLASVRVHRGIWLLGFEQIPDRTGAEGLRGTRLLTEEGEVPEEVDDEGWYEEELAGLRVVDPSGARLGEVAGLDLGASQDRLIVRLPDGSEALVPFVEALVPTVDLAAGVVVLDAPPGLLDLAGES